MVVLFFVLLRIFSAIQSNKSTIEIESIKIFSKKKHSFYGNDYV